MYRAWKGGVTLEGIVYTDRKNLQPGTCGEAYYIDNLGQAKWEVKFAEKKIPSRLIYKGYRLRENRITQIKTIAQNALVPVDKAIWLLYAAENGMNSFDDMISDAYPPGLSHRHS